MASAAQTTPQHPSPLRRSEFASPQRAVAAPQTSQPVAPAPSPAPGAPPDALAGILANAVLARAPQATVARSAAPALLGRARPGLIQRTPESDMIADPEGFLATRMVSLDYAEGMRLRAPALAMDREAFVKGLGSFTRHWFALTPNPARTKDDRVAYLLTPAIERYVETFPDNPLVAGLVGNPLLPAVAAETTYLRAAYVPYLTKKASDPETDVGHVDVRIERSDEEFSPDFVFTAAMNGCAFTVTGAADGDSFTAWHYQSPGSNRQEASRFRSELSPSDWFGAEEYDSGDHPGLFEVTNLMWRPADGGWKILSQEVDMSAMDMNDARIRRFRSRPLVLDPGGELEYTRRVYLASAQTQLAEMQRSIDNTRLRHVVAPEPDLFTKLYTAVGVHMNAERARLVGAGDFAALSAAALQARAARADTLEIQLLANTIARSADLRREADLRKFKFRQNRDLQETLQRRADDMAHVLALLARTAWLGELAAEAGLRVPVAEEEHEEPAVADGAVEGGELALPLAI